MATRGDVYQCSTQGLPAEAAFQQWLREVRSRVTRLDIASRMEADFRGEFRQRRIGPLWFTSLSASQQSGMHDAGRPGLAEHRFDLVYMRQGRMDMEQDGERASLGRDGCLIVSHLRDFAFTTSVHAECFLIACAGDWLRGWLPDPEACVMRPIGPETPWAPSLAALLSAVGDTLDDETDFSEDLVAEQVGGSLALIFGKPAADTTQYRRDIVRELLRTMRVRHSDEGLAPGDVAAQHRISLRYLHALFASHGTSFGSALQAIRLDRARSLLRDERFRQQSVGDIALRCGFRDPAYLARLFRDRFGITPRAYRRLPDPMPADPGRCRSSSAGPAG